MEITPLVKIMVVPRELSYGLCADIMNEPANVSATKAKNFLLEFCKTLNAVFEEEYLRSPTASDLERIESKFQALGFTGCIGALYCAEWVWKNCPVSL